MSENKKWVVTAAKEGPLSELKQKLRDMGFHVDQVLSEIGCITGSASDEVIGRVRKAPGVADVSPESPMGVGPPDSPVTW